MLVLTCRILTQVALGHFKPVVLHKNLPKAFVFDVPFRCLPFDIDLFMHMNNASFVRCAELARWRILSQSGILELTKKKVLFLVVGQTATYLKQLPPFAPYVVRTTISVEDNKWIHYNHSFQKPDQEGKDPYVYCTVDCKAVLKERSGKTLRITDLGKEIDFYKHLAGQDQQSS
jgi:acyl-CoA thioesterase FadM